MEWGKIRHGQKSDRETDRQTDETNEQASKQTNKQKDSGGKKRRKTASVVITQGGTIE